MMVDFSDANIANPAVGDFLGPVSVAVDAKQLAVFLVLFVRNHLEIGNTWVFQEDKEV